MHRQETKVTGQTDLKAWFSKCNEPKQHQKVKTTIQTPSLIGGSTKTGTSSIPALKRSAFSNTVGVKIIVKEESGGISDHDEMNGEEGQAVHRSPVKKRKTCVWSDVSIFMLWHLCFP